MQTLIWAFGSMIVLLLILSFLPLGFSLKGKSMIVLASFVLALAGLGAMTTFSLWLTGLMLVVLIFFAAYLMDRKMGSFLYIENLAFTEDVIEENEILNQDAQLLNDNYLLKIEKTELELPSFKSMPINSKSKPVPELKESPQKKEHLAGIIDEDIAAFMERNDDKDTLAVHIDNDNEIGYLSEIEDLLVDEPEEKAEKLKADWLGTNEKDELATVVHK